MECSCVYVDVDSSADFSLDKIQKARKLHVCCECGKTIEIGEKYELCSGMWDGCFSIYKTCLDCLDIRHSFFCDGWYYSEIMESLWSHVVDMNGVISESCLYSLRP